MVSCLLYTVRDKEKELCTPGGVELSASVTPGLGPTALQQHWQLVTLSQIRIRFVASPAAPSEQRTSLMRQS